MNLPPFAITVAQLLTIPEAIPLRPADQPVAPAAVQCEEATDDRDKPYLDRFVRDVTQPTLTPFLPDPARATGQAVLICPGGGYAGLAIDKEGYDIARWLNSIGVAGFVLKYRSPAPSRGPSCRPYGPLRDAQRALRLIRSRAAEWGVKPDCVGIMGFSAGGHLAASASTLFHDSEENDPKLAAFSCRPDFTILVYPVISFTDPAATHVGSRTNLLGADAPENLRRKFSPEIQASAETPPAFLVQTEDDVVPVANSLLYYQALQQHGVPAELHLFAVGGHGYGMQRPDLPVGSWPERCREWLEGL